MKFQSQYSEAFIQTFGNKVVGVLGLGVTGRSCVKALQSVVSLCVCFDDKLEAVYAQIGDQLGTEVIFSQSIEDDLWNAIEILIVSPGIMTRGQFMHPLVAKVLDLQVRIISDVEMLFLKYPASRYICVTGTNGKSTVTSMIAHVLKSCGQDYIVGGNIGVPCMDLPKAYGYVLEVSSYQAELLQNAKFNLIILTNLTPDHLDRYASANEYYMAKIALLDFLSFSGVFITLFSIKNLAYQIAKNKFSHCVRARNGTLPMLALFSNEPLNIKQLDANQYQNSNFFFVAKACEILKCDQASIQIGIESFKGLPHRLEYVGKKNSISFFNDSKATNVESTLYAFALMDSIYWIAGGKKNPCGIDLSPLLQYQHKIVRCYFFGESRLELNALFGSIKACYVGQTLEEAFHSCVNDALAYPCKSNILFSPAHKSFDQFKNFEERGIAFIELCKNII